MNFLCISSPMHHLQYKDACFFSILKLLWWKPLCPKNIFYERNLIDLGFKSSQEKIRLVKTVYTHCRHIVCRDVNVRKWPKIIHWILSTSTSFTFLFSRTFFLNIHAIFFSFFAIFTLIFNSCTIEFIIVSQ